MNTKINAKLGIVLGACLAVILSACGATSHSLILGKWEVENAPMKMTAEFRPDGMAKITIFGQTLQGKYKLSDDDELEWSMNGMSTKGKVNVTATELEITDSENRTIKYRRKVN
jgi:major membrane immunogen (membrane-anchored lipoprotein)